MNNFIWGILGTFVGGVVVYYYTRHAELAKDTPELDLECMGKITEPLKWSLSLQLTNKSKTADGDNVSVVVELKGHTGEQMWETSKWERDGKPERYVYKDKMFVSRDSDHALTPFVVRTSDSSASKITIVYEIGAKNFKKVRREVEITPT